MSNIKRLTFHGLAALLIIIIFSQCNNQVVLDISQATFVGRETCIECHADEYHAWKGSDHDNAMDTAIAGTVLGDFDNAEFEYNGFVSKFYTKDGKYFVHTQGPEGKPGDFQIAYTFGVRPLQQYLIPFEKGRYQCLQITWDTDKNRWYHLSDSVYNGEVIKPDDWLYWTNNAQNWNAMCAECHSTNLQKNYNPETHVYNTTWSEIDVSCEACHGAASVHLDWAEIPEKDRPLDNNLGLAVQTSNITSHQFVDQCAYCHARRSSFGDFVQPRNNAFDIIGPQLPIEPYYHSDGQILEEDYVYASFTQSKMYMNQVQCNNCHDVHSLKVKFDGGNELCQQCHVKTEYDTYQHHFHKYPDEKGDPLVMNNGKKVIEVGEGSSCVNCHMPGGYYMGVDYRRDHSFRIPRPDLSLETENPNACNQCHADKTVEWAASFTEKWYGLKKRSHFGETFYKVLQNDGSSVKGLTDILNDKLNPPIVRAAATRYLGQYRSQETNAINRQLLNDPNPMVRNEAIKSFVPNDISDFVNTLSPLLNDPTRLVRMEAATQLVVIPPENLDSIQKTALDAAVLEYIDAMEYSADFAASRHNLGNLYSNLGKGKKAEENYLEALRIDNLFYPAKINLAMLYNGQGKNDKAEILLRDVVKNHPELPDTYYSLGLLLAETGSYEEASEFLQKATELLPDRPRIFYNLALILQYLNKPLDAEKAFLSAYEIDTTNPDYLMAIIDFYMKADQKQKAKVFVEKWIQLYPKDAAGQQLLDVINNEE